MKWITEEDEKSGLILPNILIYTCQSSFIKLNRLICITSYRIWWIQVQNYFTSRLGLARIQNFCTQRSLIGMLFGPIFQIDSSPDQLIIGTVCISEVYDAMVLVRGRFWWNVIVVNIQEIGKFRIKDKIWKKDVTTSLFLVNVMLPFPMHYKSFEGYFNILGGN